MGTVQALLHVHLGSAHINTASWLVVLLVPVSLFNSGPSAAATGSPVPHVSLEMQGQAARSHHATGEGKRGEDPAPAQREEPG